MSSAFGNLLAGVVSHLPGALGSSTVAGSYSTAQPQSKTPFIEHVMAAVAPLMRNSKAVISGLHSLPSPAHYDFIALTYGSSGILKLEYKIWQTETALESNTLLIELLVHQPSKSNPNGNTEVGAEVVTTQMHKL